MRSVPAAQSQLRNVSVRSRAEVIPASTPITVSVVPAVHDPAESLGAAIGSGRRAVVLAVCCSALFMVGLDNTIVNVGLPEIGKSLHTSVAGLQWTVAGYTIVLASLLHVLRRGGGPDRPADHLPGRPEPVHARVVAVQPGAVPVLADRASACCRGSAGACSTRRRSASSPTCSARRRTGPRRSASGTACPACPWRSGRWPAASWSARSAGAASSGRTSRSGWPRSRSPRCSCRTRRPRKGRKADPLGQVLVIVMLASLAYAIIQGPSVGWFSPRHPRLLPALGDRARAAAAGTSRAAPSR